MWYLVDMAREFVKKCHVLFSYMAMAWLDYQEPIYLTIERVLHTLSRLSSSFILRSESTNRNSLLIRPIIISQNIHYYSKRLLYNMISIRERPQSIFQFLLTIAACSVIVATINYSQLSAD